MKCAGCGADVTLAERTCHACGADLRKVGATTLGDGRRAGSGIGRSIASAAMEQLASETASAYTEFDREERKILRHIFEKSLKRLLTRYDSYDDLEKLFSQEIIPTVADMAADRQASRLFDHIEAAIQKELGHEAYESYRDPKTAVSYTEGSETKHVYGSGVLETTRAAELIGHYLSNGEAIHLSTSVFPYCKATEMACWLHACGRYQSLKNNSTIVEIADWVEAAGKKAFVVDKPRPLPPSLGHKHKPTYDVLTGIPGLDVWKLNGALRFAIALYLLGTEGTLRLQPMDVRAGQAREFDVRNVIRAGGSEPARQELAIDLSAMQDVRNNLAHLGNLNTPEDVQKYRRLAYECLRRLPTIMPLDSSEPCNDRR